MLQLFRYDRHSETSKSCSTKYVIDISKLRISNGEIVAVMGPVGSGKDHLLDLLIGNTPPTAGSVRIGDTDPTQRDSFSRLAGVLFSADGLQTREGRLPTQFTVSELEEHLARSGFFRAHRSYLVIYSMLKKSSPIHAIVLACA